MKEEHIAIFAGSFDPLTLGHLDLIQRSARLFDQVIVLVATNSQKSHLFSTEDRVAFVSHAIADLDNCRVDWHTDGLVADYARKVGALTMIRGVRNSQDYEYEFTVASANRRQYPELDTVIMYARDEFRFLSSSLIKEIARFQGDLSEMVPEEVGRAIEKKFQA